jgi:hypothetical protein
MGYTAATVVKIKVLKIIDTFLFLALPSARAHFDWRVFAQDSRIPIPSAGWYLVSHARKVPVGNGRAGAGRAASVGAGRGRLAVVDAGQ